MIPEGIENLEMKLLLDAIYEAYGYNFHNYAKSSLKRRISEFKRSEGMESYLHLADTLLRNTEVFDRFLRNLSITVSEMFRDPDFFKSFKANVIPVLETYPFIRVWSAGCATGEEIYSVAFAHCHSAALFIQ